MSHADEDFDVNLLTSFADGDDSAFETLYRRHAPAVLRYAWALVDLPVQAEEVVQETFVTLWKKREAASVYDDSLLPWLLAVCKNHWRNLRRAESRHRSVPIDLASMQLSASSDLRWIEEDLSTLSRDDRRLCELCLIEGYTYREAAAALDITPVAAGKRLQRARARLREEVGKHDR